MSRILFVSAAALLLGACQATGGDAEASPENVVASYIAIAQAAYADSEARARELEEAVATLLAAPSEGSMAAAREAWIAARVPYMQTEVYRFGNPVVDEWEARVNAWPLDEGLIDYTAASYGEESANNWFYTANIIANEQLDVGGIQIDASSITPALLAEQLHMVDGVEANVATGYHAVEFLLWGQDLHGTEPGAGERPWTDFSLENCSNGNCDRRRNYLESATRLLVSDLSEMAESWHRGGEAHEDLMAKGPEGGLATMLTGMGSLAYGELAGERTRLALLLNDPEEEHDCFSDTTHLSHYYDVVGINNVYYGRYQRVDGQTVSGASLADLVTAADPALAENMDALLAEAMAAGSALVDAAENGMPFDVMIAPANVEGEALVTRFIDSLVALTRGIENVITTLDLQNTSIEGSDSLSDPGLVL